MVVALLLAMPAPAAADWLMEGHDAQGTGHADGAAPAWDDVALSVVGNDPQSTEAAAVIVGNVAYVFRTYVATVGANALTGARATLDRIDLATGAVLPSVAVDVPGAAAASSPALASDGKSLFIAVGDVLWVYDIQGAKLGPARQLPLADNPTLAGATPSDAGIRGRGQDVFLAVDGSHLYLALSPDAGAGYPFVSLFTMDLATQALAGPFVDPVGKDPPGTTGSTDSAAFAWDKSDVQLAGLAVKDGVAIVTVFRAYVPQDTAPTPFFGEPNGGDGWVWAYDTRATRANATLWTQAIASCCYAPAVYRMAPSIIADDRVVGKEAYGFTTDLRSGTETKNDNLRNTNGNVPDQGSGFAVDGGRLFAAFGDQLDELDASLNPVWQTTLSGFVFQQGPLTFADGTVLGMASSNGLSTLFAFNAANGHVLWHRAFTLSMKMATDGGLTLCYAPDGSIVLLGAPPFGLRPSAKGIDQYPAAGEVVVADLGGTPASPFGPATQFQADWGDGTVDDWQGNASLSHAYGTPGDQHARFFVRNAAGQTASLPVTFHVGQVNPSYNWLEQQFLVPQNQNQTFFVVGLIVTGLAALAGVALRGRKRRRMHREMQELEATFRRARDEPVRCEQELLAAKDRFRDLLARHRIDEDHFGLLTDRAEELLGRARVGAIEDQFAFLPYSVVRTLQVALRDGRVTGMERGVILDAIRAATDLSAEQRQRVTAQVERWSKADAKAA